LVQLLRIGEVGTNGLKIELWAKALLEGRGIEPLLELPRREVAPDEAPDRLEDGIEGEVQGVYFYLTPELSCGAARA
jgi:hypothetical protein